ncbi:MAG: hypothetical protein OHK0046_46410 [Anaerolineae bacterium]
MNAAIMTISRADVTGPGEAARLCLRLEAALVDCRSRIAYACGEWDREAIRQIIGENRYYRNPFAVVCELASRTPRVVLLDADRSNALFYRLGQGWGKLVALVDNDNHALLLKRDMPAPWHITSFRERDAPDARAGRLSETVRRLQLI